MNKASDTLSEAVKILDNVIHIMSTGKSIINCSHSIWETYSKVEYSVLMLKLYLGIENPGRIAERININKTDIKMLIKASDDITLSLQHIKANDYSKALDSARRARDILRVALLDIRKIRSR